MQKQRLYIDTSVFGGCFDNEFSAFPIPLFGRLNKGEFVLLFSTVTQDELENAPEKVRQLVTQIKTEYTEFIDVVGQTSYADCLHIALATINRADYLIGWNFKHIVNVQRIRGYNAINLKKGYKLLEIRSPRDFVHYEDND